MAGAFGEKLILNNSKDIRSALLTCSVIACEALSATEWCKSDACNYTLEHCVNNPIFCLTAVLNHDADITPPPISCLCLCVRGGAVLDSVCSNGGAYAHNDGAS